MPVCLSMQYYAKLNMDLVEIKPCVQSTDALTLYGLFTDCEDGGSCLTEHGEKLSTSITYYFLPWSVIMNARTFLSP